MKARDIPVILKDHASPELIRVLVELKEEQLGYEQSLIEMAQMIDKMSDILNQFMQGTGMAVEQAIQKKFVPPDTEGTGQAG